MGVSLADVADINRPLGDSNRIKICGFIGGVVALCPCGNPKPMTIPVIPGAGGGYQCGRCQVMWMIERIEYVAPLKLSDEQIAAGDKQEKVKLSVEARGLVPNIVVVPAGSIS